MSWPGSLGIAAITGAIGAIAMGVLAHRWTVWFRVYRMFGRHDVFLAFWEILGFAAGCTVGILSSRQVLVPSDGAFWAGLMLALTWLAGLLTIVGVTSYFLADHSPKIDGRDLDLAVELRTPPTTPLLEQVGLTPEVSIQKNPQSTSSSILVPKEAARRTNDTYILAFRIPLLSSSATRILMAEWFGNLAVRYRLPLRARPTLDDFEWTDWLDPDVVIRHGAWNAVGVDTRFQLRYRVAFEEEPGKQ